MRYIAPDQALPELTLANDADVQAHAEAIAQADVVALQFPKWVDGRAYSQATILRRRLGFKGEIRAVGEVLVDMLPLLQRTGFTAVQLRADQSVDAAQRALGFFDQGHYQGDVRETQPWFARRSAWA
jgi:uncharacterized protein (DUF934 family)